MPRPRSQPQLLATWPFDKTTGRCSSRMHHMTATRFSFTLPSLLLPPAVSSLVHALLTKHNIKPISYNATYFCAHLSHKSACNHTSTWNARICSHICGATQPPCPVSISCKGAQQQKLYFGQNFGSFSLGLGLSTWLPQFCSVEILFCLFFVGKVRFSESLVMTCFLFFLDLFSLFLQISGI